ncbi:MAG: DNA polymerase II large subunit [Candidatus Lokiarchaeota archaeon]|nr:DNA polymerase II large subunit [Candidatus Lokiarchaeota archaeon]
MTNDNPVPSHIEHELDIEMDAKTKEYFSSIQQDIDHIYSLANSARSKGLDPEEEVECPPTHDVADRVEQLIGPKGVSNRIRFLTKQGLDPDKLAFQIADEIIEGKIGTYNFTEKADRAIRVAMAIKTQGVVSAPLEGINKIVIRENPLGGPAYLSLYFSGPIRNAGGTIQAFAVLVADYVREKMGIKPYQATEQEIDRMVEEVKLYDRKVNLQYPSTKQELRFTLKNLKVELNGDPTEKYEVSAHRDLPRIETNTVRSGPVLVLNDGVILKSGKLAKMISHLNIKGWEWINKVKEYAHEKSEKTTSDETKESATPVQKRRKKLEEKIKPNFKYISGVIAGRPVISHPSQPGGFRIRYGRSRNTGLAACGLNPNTMYVCNEFLAVGTQMKIERPGKAASVLPVTSIEGPVCLLKNGDVVQFNEPRSYQKVTKNTEVEAILFLGDILFGYGEFSENNHTLLHSSYVEEWWVLELEKSLEGRANVSSTTFSDANIKSWLDDPFTSKPTGEQSVELSKLLGIPLHPAYTSHFGNVNGYELLQLRREIKDFYVQNSRKFENDEYLTIPNSDICKKVLYSSFTPHKNKKSHFELSKDLSFVFKEILSLSRNFSPAIIQQIEQKSENLTALEVFPLISDIKIRDKGVYYMGARMGRPEKAEFKKLKHSIQVLFPLGHGKSRNLEKVMRSGNTSSVDIVIRQCPICGETTYRNQCLLCKKHTIILKYCTNCEKYESALESECTSCHGYLSDYQNRKINFKSILDDLSPKMKNLKNSDLNGVEGLTSQFKVPEPIEKGILRARNEVWVYKDGTIRFDALDIPLTHFTPMEIGTSVETLRKLGYTEDYKGKTLVDKNQICELKCQDFIAPEHCGDYFIKVANFVDEELEYFYELPRFYNCTTREEVIGHYFAGLSPHTSAAIVGRLIGYAPIQALYAHPYWHAAKRRNCDGDEDGIMLLLDLLLNFSKFYLSSKIGGKMDAPLVLIVTLNPDEIDSEAWNIDCAAKYNLDFYELSSTYPKPEDIEKKKLLDMDIVKYRIGKSNQFTPINFTHPTKSIKYGPKLSAYKRLKEMGEKIQSQLELQDKIRAVNAKDVAQNILKTHFTPDIMGNLRTFSQQEFLCKNASCGTKYRRIPLSGKCNECGGELKLTVTQGGIEKYLQRSLDLCKKYDLSLYTKQRFQLMDEYVKSLTDNPKLKQVKITNFFK